MTEHIGIVACSAEGAALCYRTLCAEGAALLGPHGHPEITMHTPSLADYVVFLDRDDWKGVGDLMLRSAEKLARVGADFLICPGRAPRWHRRRGGSGGSRRQRPASAARRGS